MIRLHNQLPFIGMQQAPELIIKFTCANYCGKYTTEIEKKGVEMLSALSEHYQGQVDVSLTLQFFIDMQCIPEKIFIVLEGIIAGSTF